MKTEFHITAPAKEVDTLFHWTFKNGGHNLEQEEAYKNYGVTWVVIMFGKTSPVYLKIYFATLENMTKFQLQYL